MHKVDRLCDSHKVAPHVGAWIEMQHPSLKKSSGNVAPHVGAWIEINYIKFAIAQANVAPHVGAWIEIRLDFVVPRCAVWSLLM